MVSPNTLIDKLPLSEKAASGVVGTRKAIKNILYGDDKRLMVIVGPCSIHDTNAAMDYANKLLKLKEELSEDLLIVMRVYFEKPRTTVGWKGLIMDPQLNGTCDIPVGVRLARSFLGEVLDLGIPTATELLDPITPQYLADSLSWAAIGARTSESQTHRQMASGLSMPVGFKNATSGDLKAAVNGIIAATQSQTFLGITEDGRASAVTTGGNPDCQIILRGGASGPNYGPEFVGYAQSFLKEIDGPCSLMIDCSHANSGKDPARQPEVLDAVSEQPVDDGDLGELILTPIGRTGSPVLRYRTGDLVRASRGVDALGFPTFDLVGGILGRTDDMLVIRGVNLYPSGVDAIVRKFSEIYEYQVVIEESREMNEILIRAECDLEIARALEDSLRDAYSLRIPVESLSKGTLPRFEMKAKRWIRPEKQSKY